MTVEPSGSDLDVFTSDGERPSTPAPPDTESHELPAARQMMPDLSLFPRENGDVANAGPTPGRPPAPLHVKPECLPTRLPVPVAPAAIAIAAQETARIAPAQPPLSRRLLASAAAGLALAARAGRRRLSARWSDRSRPAKPRTVINASSVVLATLLAVGLAELGWIAWQMSSRSAGPKRSERPNAVPAVAASTVTPPVTAAPEPALPHASDTIVRFDRTTALPGASAAGHRSAWIAVVAPVAVEVFEDGRLLGGSGSGIVLTPGRHALRVVNRAFDIDAPASIDIAAGDRGSLVVDHAPGLVSFTASPMASVRVDGSAAGTTPLLNLRLTPGRHDVQFTHPQLGQRQLTIAVASGKRQRVSADLTR